MRLSGTKTNSIHQYRGLGDQLWDISGTRPSLDLRFADSKSLVDATTGQNLVTFTRASSGTYVGSNGVLQTAANDVPRFDHNPTTGESLGLLVEEQRTNLVFPSSDLTSINYVKARSSLSAATVAPDGTSTAFGIIEDTSTNSHEIRSPGFAITLGQAVSYSFYVKPSGRNQIFFSVGAGFGGPNDIVITNLNSSSYSTSVGGGWYRISGTFVPTATTTAFVYFGPASGGSKSYTGDGVTIGSYFWGFQIEAGSFPTSYIPTTTATATRSADVASITGANFSSWYRQDEGTVFSEFALGGVASQNKVVNFDAGAGFTDSIDMYCVSGTPRYEVYVGSVVQAQLGMGPSIGANAATKVIGAYKANDFGATRSGAVVITDGSGTIPSTVRMGIGAQLSGGQYLNGTIRRLTYWPARLANSTLQDITR